MENSVLGPFSSVCLRRKISLTKKENDTGMKLNIELYLKVDLIWTRVGLQEAYNRKRKSNIWIFTSSRRSTTVGQSGASFTHCLVDKQSRWNDPQLCSYWSAPVLNILELSNGNNDDRGWLNVRVVVTAKRLVQQDSVESLQSDKSRWKRSCPYLSSADK